MQFVYAFLGFALLIVLHEAGHFAAAKAVGMRVEKFSLFFGPMWAKRTIGETVYGVAVIPLGGYVKITGMTPGEVYETPEVEARAYMNQPVWKRIVVIAAGPAVNLVLAFFLAWVFFLGQTHPLTTKAGAYIPTPTIAAVGIKTPAAKVLKPGDVLVSVDGVRGSATAMHDQIRTHQCANDAKVNGCVATTPATLVVRRDGVLRTFKLRPVYNKAAKEPLVGVEFVDKFAPNTVGYAASASVTGLWNVATTTLSDIAQIFKAKDRDQLRGVAGAYAYTAQQFNSSLSSGMQILAIVSLGLAVVNLLPFLPLDGGHIFWALVEKFRGHRIPLVVTERATIVGIALILVLFVIGVSNDVTHGFTG